MKTVCEQSVDHGWRTAGNVLKKPLENQTASELKTTMDGNVTLYEQSMADVSFVTEDETLLVAFNSSINTSTFYGENMPVILEQHRIHTAILLFVAVLGIIGNIFSLAVWKMETSFNTTVFLFKFLGVWDTVYLVSVVTYCSFVMIPTLFNSANLILSHVGSCSQMVSAHVTLFIAISRWISVTFPFHAQRMLTSCKVYLACVFILMYCGIMEVFNAIYTLYYIDEKHFIVQQSVGLILPMVLLVIFNVSLLWTATRRPNILSQTQLKKVQQQAQRQSERTDQQAAERTTVCTNMDTEKVYEIQDETHEGKGEGDQQQQIHRQLEQHLSRQDQAVKSNTSVTDHVKHFSNQQPRRRHMVKAVLLVSLCSFISYPIGVGLRIYLIFSRVIHMEEAFMVFHIINLCHAVNSSINVFIYWFFVSRFRQLATSLRNHRTACH